jgi:adenylate kinase family enzyme
MTSKNVQPNKEYDFRLNNGSVVQIVGPSGSGKTYFACNLLSRPEMFKLPIREIYWHSGVKEEEIGPTLKKLEKLKQVHHVFGLPKGWTDNPKQYDAIVIDDLFVEANRDAATFNQLFTKIARHRQVTVLFLTQNLFHQGGGHRTRNLNTHYLVIFKNPRDKTVIDFLSRQVYPNNRKFLINVFEDATKNRPHGYLFMDFTQDCPDDVRIRTDIFNKRTGALIYKQKSN